MKGFLASPFVQRILGAAGAGVMAYGTGQVNSWQGAGLVALSFLGYSTVHSTVSALTTPAAAAAAQSGYVAGTGKDAAAQ